MASPVIGHNVEVIMDGYGYNILPNSFVAEKKRLHRTRITKNGIMHTIDSGPLFYQYKFTVIISTNLQNIDGSYDSRDVLEMRNQLWNLYGTVNNPFLFQTPNNDQCTCIFVDLKERNPNHSTYIGNPAPGNLLELTDFLMDCELLQTGTYTAAPNVNT